MVPDASAQSLIPERDKGDGFDEAHRWMVRFARFGYVTKGLIYTLLGLLTLRAAWSAEQVADGETGALKEISQQPFGQLLLILIALGLAGYVAWRLVQAVTDPDNKGSDWLGWIKRSGYLISAGAYMLLTYYALRASISGYVQHNRRSKQELTAWLFSLPLGRYLVVAVGLAVIGVGLNHFYRSYSAKFMEEYNRAAMGEVQWRWARRIGRLGLAARGVAFCLIGLFLTIAGVQIRPEQAKGLGEALQALARQPYGAWLLAIAGMGFIAYGIYCVSRARYRSFAT